MLFITKLLKYLTTAPVDSIAAFTTLQLVIVNSNTPVLDAAADTTQKQAPLEAPVIHQSIRDGWLQLQSNESLPFNSLH